MVRAGPRPAMRSTLWTMRSVRKPLVGKCRSASRDQPATISVEDVVDVAAQKDLAAGQIEPR